MNTTNRVKMTEAYPRWIGPPPPNFQRERKGKEQVRLYMEVKTLKQWSVERGLSIEAIAEQLDVAVSTVRGWLNGQRRPLYPRMVQLAEMLNVRVEQINWDWSRTDISELPVMPRSPEFSPTVIATLVSREQYEIGQVWLAAGRSKTEIANAMGVSRETYYKAVARFESGLSDEEYEAQAKAKQVAAAAIARESRKPAQKPSKKAKVEKVAKAPRKAVKAVQ